MCCCVWLVDKNPNPFLGRSAVPSYRTNDSHSQTHKLMQRNPAPPFSLTKYLTRVGSCCFVWLVTWLSCGWCCKWIVRLVALNLEFSPTRPLVKLKRHSGGSCVGDLAQDNTQKHTRQNEASIRSRKQIVKIPKFCNRRWSCHIPPVITE